MTVAFEILDYLRQETDDLPWKPVVNRVLKVKKILRVRKQFMKCNHILTMPFILHRNSFFF